MWGFVCLHQSHAHEAGPGYQNLVERLGMPLNIVRYCCLPPQHRHCCKGCYSVSEEHQRPAHRAGSLFVCRIVPLVGSAPCSSMSRSLPQRPLPSAPCGEGLFTLQQSGPSVLRLSGQLCLLLFAVNLLMRDRFSKVDLDHAWTWYMALRVPVGSDPLKGNPPGHRLSHIERLSPSCAMVPGVVPSQAGLSPIPESTALLQLLCTSES